MSPGILLRDILGPFLLCFTESVFCIWLCGAKKASSVLQRLWPLWLFLFSLVYILGSYFLYSLLAGETGNLNLLYSFVLRYAIFMAATFFFTDLHGVGRFYVASLLLVTYDLSRMLLGRISILLFETDYIMGGLFPAFLLAHALLFLFRIPFIALVRRKTASIIGSMQNFSQTFLLVLPALPFLLLREYARYIAVQPGNMTPAYFFFTVFTGLCALANIIAGGYIVHRKHLREIAFLESLMDKQQEQHAALQNAMESVDRSYHDLRHTLHGIEAMEDVSEIKAYARALIGGIQDYSLFASTGNPAIDVILSEKHRQCREKDVRLHFHVEIAGWERVHRADIAVLFGNALDNALEGAAECEDPSLRCVEMRVNEVNEILIARFENGFQHTLQRDGESFHSTKANPYKHGYGIKSIRAVAARYDGEVDIQTENGSFILTILIPRAQTPN